MTTSSKDKLCQLESRIENMLDKLIETDDELEKNDSHCSYKYSDDISSDLEIEKNEDYKFEKALFLNSIFQSEERSKVSSPVFSPKNSNNTSKFLPNNMNSFNIAPLKMNLIYNNYNPFNFNYIYQNQNNNANQNNGCNGFNSKIYGLYKNNNIYNNFNQMNNDTLNTTTASFSSNYDNNINNFMNLNNNNNSYMNLRYQNSNNSFNIDNNKYMNKKSKKIHNSYYAGDKICFNKKFKNSKNNSFFNSNVEMEMLLIEINKILNKIEKIDQIFFNKLKGKFEQIIRTHKGSRIFQNYLKNTHVDILHQIFLEIKNNLPDLLKDNYANYFCKKFFDCISQKDRIEYLTIIQNDLNTLAIDVTATYPIQGIIEQLGSKAEKKIIYLGIKDYIPIFCFNIYGTHILEKILSYFEDEFTMEIIDYVYNNFIDLACHINGICIVKKLLLMTHKKDLHQKLKKIIYDNALSLIVHQYGNYVIQVIFENWDDNELEEILSQYKNKYIYLSKLKYSSNAIERIIEKNNINLEFYINEICKENNISQLMLNNYGNYVIQKALKLSSGKSHERLIQFIMQNLYFIEDKKIIHKWKMITSSNSSF